MFCLFVSFKEKMLQTILNWDLCLFLPKKMSRYYSLQIKEIIPLTPSSVALSFDVPEELRSLFTYHAGQYMSLEAQLDGKPVRRSYSLSSAPHEKQWQVGIKKVPLGLFSTHANENLVVGDQLTVSVPEGRFIYSPSKEKELLFTFAAGSGITPILSIIKTALETSKTSKIQLVYGNKSPKETMFKHDIEALQVRFPSRLNVIWVYSQSNESSALFGRIDTAILNYAFNQHDLLPDQVYLCGPEAMLNELQAAVSSKGLSSDQIHYELFTVSVKDKTDVNQESENVQLTITSEEETQTIETTTKQTLLDAALSNDIDVPYSCQGGVCCSCIGKIRSGSAQMKNNQVLTDEEIQEGLVLTCQAYPTSSKVSVDYDDV